MPVISVNIFPFWVLTRCDYLRELEEVQAENGEIKQTEELQEEFKEVQENDLQRV